MGTNVDAHGFENALRVGNRNQTRMIAHNMNKDQTLDPIGAHWVEERSVLIAAIRTVSKGRRISDPAAFAAYFWGSLMEYM